MQSNLAGYLIIGGFLILIIAINISLITALKNKSINKPMEMYRSAFDTVKSPWQPEDEALQELSKIVHQLSPDNPEDPGENNN
jgi:hypothetical protein